jgi:carbamoyltransferase
MPPSAGKSIGLKHHVAHLASAFLVCPFREAAIISVDGFGDFSSAAWGTGHGTSISVDAACTALTQYLGFPLLRR